MQRQSDFISVWDCLAPGARPFTKTQTIILRDLLERKFCTRERLWDQLWGTREDGGILYAKKCLTVHIGHLRKRLAPTLRIDNEWGRGYSITGFVP